MGLNQCLHYCHFKLYISSIKCMVEEKKARQLLASCFDLLCKETPFVLVFTFRYCYELTHEVMAFIMAFYWTYYCSMHFILLSSTSRFSLSSLPHSCWSVISPSMAIPSTFMFHVFHSSLLANPLGSVPLFPCFLFQLYDLPKQVKYRRLNKNK